MSEALDGIERITNRNIIHAILTELHPSGSSVGYPSPIRIGVVLLSPSAVALKVA